MKEIRDRNKWLHWIFNVIKSEDNIHPINNFRKKPLKSRWINTGRKWGKAHITLHNKKFNIIILNLIGLILDKYTS